MVKFYAYYNCGGYKDMYLGSNSDNCDFKYYLPLLGVYEEELKNAYDAETERYLSKYSSLPEIILLNDSTSAFNYPYEARRMISHAGYKLIFRSVSNGDTILSMRDISGMKDSYGRSAPFTFLAVADSDSKGELSVVAEHMRSNIQEWENFLFSLFIYDLEVNGLRFDIGKLCHKINSVCEIDSTVIDYNSYNRKIHFVVVPHRNELELCLKEQDISCDDINVVYDTNGNKTIFDLHQDNSGFYEGPSSDEYSIYELIERITKLENRVKTLEKLMKL